MPRRLRIHAPGGFYHATLRGNHQQAIFHTESDRRLLNAIVARCLDTYFVRLHAYCWMTNHLHLLVQVSDQPLASFMRQAASEFARAMQIKMSTTGHLFERRYHATLVDADSYLLELVRYIHLNPVRANIVPDPGLFAWSSHHVYVGARKEPWVTTDFVLREFSTDRARAVQAYRDFVRSVPTSDIGGELEQSVDRIGILGSDEFKRRMQCGASVPRQCQDLAALLQEASRRFGFDVAKLRSPVRDPYLTKVRAWIAHQAVTRRIAPLAEVARSVGRNEATLREAMQKYPQEIE
jgi:putative transposase